MVIKKDFKTGKFCLSDRGKQFMFRDADHLSGYLGSFCEGFFTNNPDGVCTFYWRDLDIKITEVLK